MFFTFIISIISIFIANMYGKRYSLNNRILNPPTILGIFILTYCILGVVLHWKGNYYFLGFDHSPNLDLIYNQISIFIAAFVITYIIAINSIKQKKILQKNWRYEIKNINLINYYCIINLLIAFLIPISGSLGNLKLLIVNSLIPIVGYLYVIKKSKLSYLFLFFFTILAISYGFRYRLALLYLPIVLFALIKTESGLKKIFKLGTLFLFFIFLISILGVTRTYSQGLNLYRIESLSLMEILIQGIFNDTNTIISSGTFLAWFERHGEYAHFNQVRYVLEYFIPNTLLESKQYSPILTYTQTALGDDQSGTAALGFAEYYHTGGIFGVLFFSALFSYTLTLLYKKQLTLKNTYHQFLYLSILVWFINSLTRGYFPQNTSDLISILIGFYIIRIASVRSRLF